MHDNPHADSEDHALFELCDSPDATPEQVQDLINHGADVNATLENGMTPLHAAARSSENSSVIAALIDAGADADARDEKRSTPLHYAVTSPKNNHHVITELIDSGADVNANSPHTPLSVLSRAISPHGPHYRTKMHALMTAGGTAPPRRKISWLEPPRDFLFSMFSDDPSRSNLEAILASGSLERNLPLLDDGVTPLHEACEHCINPDAIKALIDFGEEVTASDKYGRTPLHYAASYNRNPAVAKLLIQAGAEIIARDAHGRTPLHAAAQSAINNLDFLSTLIDAGAEMNAEDDSGETPLHYATKCKMNPKIHAAIINAGADTNAKDATGSTPLHAAAKKQNPKVFNALIKAGADVNALDNHGSTPLHAILATNRAARIEVLRVLLAAGASLAATDATSSTPLHIAARRNHTHEVVTFLIEAGASVDATDASGQTALHHAAAASTNLEMLEALINAGADVSAKDEDGNTPFGLAIERNSNDAIATLLANARIGLPEKEHHMTPDESADPDKAHAMVIARCWRDETFKDRFIADPQAILIEHGMRVPAGIDIEVVQNTAKLVHITLPALLDDGEEVPEEELIDAAWGIPPCSNGYMYISGFTFFLHVTRLTWLILAIQQDTALHDRLLSEPREVLAEYDMKVPDDMTVKVVENTEACVHVTIPSPPNDHASMSMNELVGEAEAFYPPSRL